MSEQLSSAAMKSGAQKYVKTCRACLIAFSVVLFPVLMYCFVVAINGYLGGIVFSAALALLWIVVYAFYAMRVSMGTVIGYRLSGNSLQLVTKRKSFTYDAEHGCSAMVRKGNKYVGTFQTQDSEDKFVFYRRAPFSKYSDGQFTEEELLAFCPYIVNGDRGGIR